MVRESSIRQKSYDSQYSKAKLDGLYRTKQKELFRGCTEVEIRKEPSVTEKTVYKER